MYLRIATVALTLVAIGCGSRQPEPVAPEPQTATPEQAVKAPPFRGWSGTQPGDVVLDRWQTPESCSECHDSIFSQWQGTMHSNAGRDPLYLAQVEQLRGRVTGEVERNELRTCTRCHSGAGHLSAGAVDSFSDLGPLTGLYDRGGNFCHLCHSVNESSPRDGWYQVEPGPSADDLGTIRGPHDDARNDGHAVSYSQLHTLASFCGTCHDQNHAGSAVVIQSTFSEWRDGPYNTGEAETTVVCQDCHMRQIAEQPTAGATPRPDRPGRSAPALGTLSPERPHVWAHNLVGGNTLIPPLLADDTHGQMASQRLRAAATVEVVVPERARAGEQVTVEVRVTNSGAGHSIPTGVTDIRQMWLELRVGGVGDDEAIFESGSVTDNGELAEETRVFGRVYANAAGERAAASSRATKVLRDHRIGPRETVSERYEITIPAGSTGSLEVTARLKYRPASPALVSSLLGSQAPRVIITAMAEGRATLEIQPGEAPETEAPAAPAESPPASDQPDSTE